MSQWHRPKAAGTLILVIAALFSYFPAYSAGFIWDDDDHITNNTTLRSLDGLRDIWLDPTSVPQYYPLTHTAFWIEYHIWGLAPAGYHIVNVLLHASNAILLWAVLGLLAIPGAFWIALLFAVHPICVESVAWITEQKTLLSAFFYGLSFLAYWQFISSAKPRMGKYWLSLFLFVCAMFSKTVACSLPAVFVLVLWWKHRPIRIAIWVGLLPFIVIGLLLSRVTAYLEVTHVGARGPAWNLTFAQRCLIAGRASWFYFVKAIWPLNLSFNYPRWNVDPHQLWQWIAPAATMVVGVLLWMGRRRIGRGPLIAFFYFCGTLVPALGFFNIYPMRYSFVADHFAYMSCIGILGMAVGLAHGVAQWLRNRGLRNDVVTYAGIFVVLMFAAGTFRQSSAYADSQTIWTRTLISNPGSSIAHYYVGKTLMSQGREEEALAQFLAATQNGSVIYEPSLRLGSYYLSKGDFSTARQWCARATQLQPDSILAHQLLAFSLAYLQEYQSALAEYEKAYQLHLAQVEPTVEAAQREFRYFVPQLTSTQGYASLGQESAAGGRIAEAEEADLKALAMDPTLDWVRANLERLMKQSIFTTASATDWGK